MAASSESINLFSSSSLATPKASFNVGDTVWATVTGIPGGGGFRFRRFQWVAPDGTIIREKEIRLDGEVDSLEIPKPAQLGRWTVKTIDNSNSGFAVEEFLVRDPSSPSVDLSVNLSGPLQVSAGQNLSFFLQVTNNGPDAAQWVHLTDATSGAVTFQALEAPTGWSCLGGGATTCTIANLGSGVTAKFTFVYQVSPDVHGGSTISNTVEISSDTRELQVGNNTSTASVTFSASACTLESPANITQAPDPGVNGAVVTYPDPAPSSDRCGAIVCNLPSGTFFPGGVTTVVCSSQNGGHSSFTVTVTGAVAISLVGPELMIVECHSDFEDPGATAQDDGAETILVAATGDVNPDKLGTYKINYTASGGSVPATATRTVKVVDTTPPVIKCPSALVVRMPSEATTSSMAVSYGVTAEDQCSQTTVAAVPASGSLFPVGVTTVTATATDASNNSTACSFPISVLLYQFKGFVEPIGPLPAFSTFRAGTIVPIKFSLNGEDVPHDRP